MQLFSSCVDYGDGAAGSGWRYNPRACYDEGPADGVPARFRKNTANTCDVGDCEKFEIQHCDLVAVNEADVSYQVVFRGEHQITDTPSDINGF